MSPVADKKPTGTATLATLRIPRVTRSLTRWTLSQSLSPMALWFVPLHLFPLTMRPHFALASCMS
jgi:hypothetical protein